MRHRIKSNQFNRHTKSRKALLVNLVRSLLEKGSITTTRAKAIETMRLSDKLIARAKKNDLASRRLLHRFFGKRDVVNALVDQIAPQFDDRQSGFTTINILGVRRGDASVMAKVSLIRVPENYQGFRIAKTQTAQKKTEKQQSGDKNKQASPKKVPKTTTKKTTDTTNDTKKKKVVSSKKSA